MPGDSRVLPSEHADVKVCVTGEDIFQPAVNNMELEMDVPDRIVVRGEGELVCQPVLYDALQHGDIVAAGVILPALRFFAFDIPRSRLQYTQQKRDDSCPGSLNTVFLW